jgi:hypothetical protein
MSGDKDVVEVEKEMENGNTESELPFETKMIAVEEIQLKGTGQSKESSMRRMEMGNDKELGYDNNKMLAITKENETSPMVEDQILKSVEAVQSNEVSNSMGEQGAWDKQITNKDAEVEITQESRQDGWSAWQQVRQSKIIKETGTSHLKMDGQDQNRMNKELGNEGTSPLQ